jgi:hypothetical protein
MCQLSFTTVRGGMPLNPAQANKQEGRRADAEGFDVRQIAAGWLSAEQILSKCAPIRVQMARNVSEDCLQGTDAQWLVPGGTVT